ncbi:peptidyl-prolyl cis-trans isomerase [Pseudoalteromonas sp. MMG024]|uniref:peptidyl-prolyl cis-trans isomerase n=1 Tax=Pseudoalteromonas sp. MMG024 TaxID=2909980 RepID=UPI001F2784D0|nr:peptidyl-prolyl cis-trans isomerase [Pseudoalteromonas sp. MMG024]MCF6457513.1 peptidyl-prolyl cis-trans isomerase [Pseudoalteromonas sp. MMG024]
MGVFVSFHVKLATNTEWWMQEFKTKQNKRSTGKLEKSYTKADFAKLIEALSVPPKGRVMLGSLGYTKVKEHDKFVKRLKKGRVLRPFNIKNWILSPQVKAMLLSEFIDVLAETYDGQTSSDYEWEPQC